MPNSSHRWSAKDIIEKYSEFGIPHFQRGLVWGEESVSLLLESLYYGTPCGELVLWRPRYPIREGIPLDPFTPPRHLVIDGQQRIRSIWDALAVTENATDLDMESSAEADGREIWCLNLCKVRELRNYFDDNDDFPLFRLLRDPLDPKVRSRYKHNLVPLACFLRDRPLEEYFGLLKVKKDKDLLALRKDIEGLRPRVQQLYTQCVFSVTTLVERNGKHTLPDVVALYNRINSGGMRVEPEERAFATLASLRPTETSTWLRDLFKKIHDADETPSAMIS